MNTSTDLISKMDINIQEPEIIYVNIWNNVGGELQLAGIYIFKNIYTVFTVHSE